MEAGGPLRLRSGAGRRITTDRWVIIKILLIPIIFIWGRQVGTMVRRGVSLMHEAEEESLLMSHPDKLVMSTASLDDKPPPRWWSVREHAMNLLIGEAICVKHNELQGGGNLSKVKEKDYLQL